MSPGDRAFGPWAHEDECSEQGIEPCCGLPFPDCTCDEDAELLADADAGTESDAEDLLELMDLAPFRLALATQRYDVACQARRADPLSGDAREAKRQALEALLDAEDAVVAAGGVL